MTFSHDAPFSSTGSGRPPVGNTALSGKTVLLGITGSIAAYKSLTVLRDLKAAGAEVRVVLTKTAARFVPVLTLQVFSDHPVQTDLFESENEMVHIHLAQEADLVLIAPVTAHFMAKMVMGLNDDLLSSILLATTAPVIIAPAMDLGMWAHPATQENVSILIKRGIKIIGPEVGRLASGKTGMGRFSEPANILKQTLNIFSKTQALMAGERVLVTAGPTEEAIDPVRFISNRSSGKMGYAIAETAKRWGARVVLISGPTALSEPEGVELIRVRSAKEMKIAVERFLPESSLVVMAAAVGDYRPRNVSPEKIKKTGTGYFIELEETADILAERPTGPKGQVVVGFAAETQDVIENATRKLKKKRLDLIVANDITAEGAGFDVETNIVHLIDAEGKVTSPPKQLKQHLAEHLLKAALEIKRHRTNH